MKRWWLWVGLFLCGALLLSGCLGDAIDKIFDQLEDSLSAPAAASSEPKVPDQGDAEGVKPPDALGLISVHYPGSEAHSVRLDGHIQQVAYSADGELLAAATTKGLVLFDTQTMLLTN
ncbi:hypothetical protein ACFLZW_02590 [Chloroflexota bacterium]